MGQMVCPATTTTTTTTTLTLIKSQEKLAHSSTLTLIKSQEKLVHSSTLTLIKSPVKLAHSSTLTLKVSHIQTLKIIAVIVQENIMIKKLSSVISTNSMSIPTASVGCRFFTST